MMMVTKEAHGMTDFLRLGPLVNDLSVRIGLRKAHHHSLFMHPFCIFNVYMWYVYWGMIYMCEICIWMDVECHAIYAWDMYVDTCYIYIWYIYIDGWHAMYVWDIYVKNVSMQCIL